MFVKLKLRRQFVKKLDRILHTLINLESNITSLYAGFVFTADRKPTCMLTVKLTVRFQLVLSSGPIRTLAVTPSADRNGPPAECSPATVSTSLMNRITPTVTAG